MREIGYVEEGSPGSVLRVDGHDRDFSPKFRESAYTPVKKVVDSRVQNFEDMKEKVLHASESALRKKNRVLSLLRKKQDFSP